MRIIMTETNKKKIKNPKECTVSAWKILDIKDIEV